MRRGISSTPGGHFLGSVLGIRPCLRKSEEFNSCAAGLGVFKGRVVRFSGRDGLKVSANWLESAPDRARRLPDLSRYSYRQLYLLSSTAFYPQPVDASIVATETDYGETFRLRDFGATMFTRPSFKSREKPASWIAGVEETFIALKS